LTGPFHDSEEPVAQIDWAVPRQQPCHHPQGNRGSTGRRARLCMTLAPGSGAVYEEASLGAYSTSTTKLRNVA
jgi:hypothetical protein